MKTASRPLHFLNYNEQKALEDVVRKLPSMLPGINRIVLYGSKARGDFTEESDVDMCLVTDSPVTRKMKFQIYDMIFEVQTQYDVVISAVFSTAEDLRSAVKTFHKQVNREGITLWLRE